MKKKLLVDLILKENTFKIINQEGNDNEANKRKRLAWEEISATINSIFNNNRTMANIYEKWSQICSEAKRRHQRRKTDIHRTGGGPAPAPLPDYLQRIIEAFGSSAKFNGTTNREIGETGLKTQKEPRGRCNSMNMTLNLH